MKTKISIAVLLALALVLAMAVPGLAQEPGDPGPEEKGDPTAEGPAKDDGDEKPAEKPAEGGDVEKPAGSGEEGAGEDPKKPKKEEVEEEIKKAQAYAKHPDKKIEVLLKRGTVFEGIARRGCLAEMKKIVKVKGHKEQYYVEVPWQAVLKPAKKEGKQVLLPTAMKYGKEGEEKTMNLRKVGIRIWYFQQTRGFVFIPYNDVAEIRVVRALSYRDSKRLFQDIESREKRLKEAERKAKDDETEREAIRREFEEQSREKKLLEQKGLEEEEGRKWLVRVKELMGKFPPEEGWSRDKKTQIMVKMIQGINPTDEEREFYKIFDEWEKARKDYEFIKGK